MGGGKRTSGTAVKQLILIAVLASGCATRAVGRPPTSSPELESHPNAWASRPASGGERTPEGSPAGVDDVSAEDRFEAESDEALTETAVASESSEESEAVQLAASKGSTKRPAKKKPMRGRRIAASASRLVGLKTLTRVTRQVPDDCTGVPRYVYRKYGIDLMDVESRPGENGVTLIHRRARKAGALHKRTPRPGDLVFFRETYDRNRDGRRNDGLTHVGIVEKVEKDGTIVFVHRGSKGVSRARMNLKTPKARAADGRVVNDFLRPSTASSRAYLTGELFSSFASPERL